MYWDSKDLESALAKIDQCKAGDFVELNKAEMDAHLAFVRATSRIEEKTMDLRYVVGNGKRVLQQRIQWYSLDRTKGGHDWRDVPVIHDAEVQSQ